MSIRDNEMLEKTTDKSFTSLHGRRKSILTYDHIDSVYATYNNNIVLNNFNSVGRQDGNAADNISKDDERNIPGAKNSLETSKSLPMLATKVKSMHYKNDSMEVYGQDNAINQESITITNQYATIESKEEVIDEVMMQTINNDCPKTDDVSFVASKNM